MILIYQSKLELYHIRITAWEPNPFFKPVKAQLSAKIDRDILAWLKLHGEVSKFLNKLLRDRMLEERARGLVLHLI